MFEQYRSAILRHRAAVEADSNEIRYSGMPQKVHVLEFLRLEMAEARRHLQGHVIDHDCSVGLT
jgi:hypothetical protein